MKTCGKRFTAFCLIYMLLYGAIAAYAQDSMGMVENTGSTGGARRGEALPGGDAAAELIRKDFALRKEQGNWRREATYEHVKSLTTGLCPDGSAVFTLKLPATGGYTDLWNIAYYCRGRNAYWVDHGNGALVGTVSLWYGPFPLGGSVFDAPDTTEDGTEKYRFELKALLGEYSGVDRIFVIPLALGTTFSQVKKASVFLKGTVHLGKGVSTDGLNRHLELPVKLQIKISDKFEPAKASLQTPVAVFGTLKGDFEDKKAFRVLLYNQKPKLDFLKDGTAELKFSWREDCTGCRFIQTASLRIDKAVLVIEGIKGEARGFGR
jgi:hypothetical protein